VGGRCRRAGRAAAHAPINKSWPVATLLDSLRKAGAREQVTVLAGQAAAGAALDDSYAVAVLLRSLREAGAQEQVTVLADRAAVPTVRSGPVRPGAGGVPWQ